jgi:AcrR family transcriptional regulator
MARRSDHTRDELREMALQAAQRIISKQGLSGLSTRSVAARMGYSSGTLYQIFDDINDLIFQVNAMTLDRLAEHCADVDFNASPDEILQNLAGRYIEYVTDNPGRWNAIIEHSLPNGRAAPEWYKKRMQWLLGLGEKAIAPFFASEEEGLRRHEANVLWASLYGIAALGTAKKLPTGETPQELVRSLIHNYLFGLTTRARVS